MTGLRPYFRDSLTMKTIWNKTVTPAGRWVKDVPFIQPFSSCLLRHTWVKQWHNHLTHDWPHITKRRLQLSAMQVSFADNNKNCPTCSLYVVNILVDYIDLLVLKTIYFSSIFQTRVCLCRLTENPRESERHSHPPSCYDWNMPLRRTITLSDKNERSCLQVSICQKHR